MLLMQMNVSKSNSMPQTNLDYSRLYATDASVYEQVPVGVAFPRDVADCIALVNRACEQRQGLISRGGGTSIAGQCVGAGMVVDFSRFMAGILSEPEGGAIWVQPGVVLDDLNDYLRPLGLQFPIDISTSSRCTIGGMVGNNAAGSHSIIYGTTRENVLEVDAVLADGSVAHFAPLDDVALTTKLHSSGLEGNIYRAVFDAVGCHREAILTAFPDPGVIRRNTGYALDVLAMNQPWVAEGRPFNLASIVCGSEGTLALVTAIRLKLSPLVGGKALACVHFASLEAAFQANSFLLGQDGLGACELIDAHILRAAADHQAQKANRAWVVDAPAAVLVAEFFADTPLLARGKAEQAVAKLKNAGIGIAWPVLDGTEAHRVWDLRKAGLGLLMGLRQRARPVAVIEDSAVPVHALPSFAHDIGQMMDRHGLDCVYYGHASVGLLHLRPALDLDDERDRDIFRSVAEETAALVKQYRGSLSGEHGDGRLRAPYLRDFLGDEIYALLMHVKRAFDPTGIFNPGKIFFEQPVDADIRQRPLAAIKNFPAGFDWQADGGFDLVLERCNGSGNCRQGTGRGAMCPTFQATGEELYSTRGRANLLRQAFSQPSAAGLDDPVLAEAMETCLSCKACKNECPSGVDMARMKAEYLYRRRCNHFWQPMRWMMKLQPMLLALFAAQPPFLRILGGRLIRKPLLMRLAGLEREPPMPSPIALSYRDGVRLMAGITPEEKGRLVLLLVDPYINHIEPEIGEAAILVLRRLGYEPELYFMDCSLRLLLSEGFLDEAKNRLRCLMDDLVPKGTMPIIGLEPAELLLLRDEAGALLSDAWPADLAAKCFLLDEFLLHEHTAGRLQSVAILTKDKPVYFHPHCHERATGNASVTAKLLQIVFGLEAKIVSTGCCGMGGSFGYRHSKLSKEIFQNNVHLPTESKIPTTLLVSGTSCRHQFRDLSATKPQHLAQFLLDAMSV